jgi:hypothetical protein
MSTISKQVVMNQLLLPKEVIEIIKEYTFHKIKRIPEDDDRYYILHNTIQPKRYDPTTNHTYVYLTINHEKDYFILYVDFEIQIQVIGYGTDRVTFLGGARYIIE